MELKKYKAKIRTTLHDLDNLPYAGVYVIAYMGRIVYVGKTTESVWDRLRSHLTARDYDGIGGWMFKVMDDWHNVRLDVLEPPDDVDNVDYWLRTTEGLLVRYFRPLFNESLNT